MSIGHFRVVCVSFSKRGQVPSVSYENEISSHVNVKTPFHVKDCAPRITLKKRHKSTRKWPIVKVKH